MSVAAEPLCHAAEEDVFRRNEAARRERYEEVLHDVDAVAVWVEVQAESRRDAESVRFGECSGREARSERYRRTVLCDNHREHKPASHPPGEPGVW